jgi:negative regulator of replication initiation
MRPSVEVNPVKAIYTLSESSTKSPGESTSDKLRVVIYASVANKAHNMLREPNKSESRER